jgi:NAD+ diphosphatase
MFFMDSLVVPSAGPPDDVKKPAWWFLFSGHKMLVERSDGGIRIPFLAHPEDAGLAVGERYFLGLCSEVQCWCGELSASTELNPGTELRGLRGLFDDLEECVFRLAMRASHIVDWSGKNRFCGRCGSALDENKEVRAKECPRCGLAVFPRISPAVIVLVERGDRVLLARATRFKENLYSVIAGFVEPGESLEETVKREVKEETGIDVGDIRYFGSQHWPFPDSLMIGFTARHLAGEISVDGTELVEARWFKRDELPEIPGKISIARALIDWFVAKGEGETEKGDRDGIRAHYSATCDKERLRTP